MVGVFLGRGHQLLIPVYGVLGSLVVDFLEPLIISVVDGRFFLALGQEPTPLAQLGRKCALGLLLQYGVILVLFDQNLLLLLEFLSFQGYRHVPKHSDGKCRLYDYHISMSNTPASQP